MITNLASASLKDLMGIALTGDYFELAQAKRESAMEKALGKTYPKSLKSYLGSVSEQDFTKDCEQMIPILGSDGSITAQANLLMKSGNGWFEAFVDGLSMIRQIDGQSELAVQMNHFRAAGEQYRRVLEREMQQLLLVAKDQDSPIVQIAAPAEIDTSNLEGVPSIEVNRSLIGGARSFHNGTLKDDSWRARLTEVISVIS